MNDELGMMKTSRKAFRPAPETLLLVFLVFGCAAVSIDTKSVFVKPPPATATHTLALDTIYDSGIKATTLSSRDPVNGVRITQNSDGNLAFEAGWDKDGLVRFTLQNVLGKELKVFTQGEHARGTLRFHLSSANYAPGEYYLVLQTQGHTWKTKFEITK